MTGYRIDRQMTTLGAHVRGWRMVLGLTAQQVSERAGITRDTTLSHPIGSWAEKDRPDVELDSSAVGMGPTYMIR